MLQEGRWSLPPQGSAGKSSCLFLLAKFITSAQFSLSVVSDSLWPHGLQRTRPPCPSPTPRVYSDLCPSSRWCHPATSCAVPFSCLQSFPASGSFPVSQLFTSGGQSIGVSASASVLQWIFRTDFLYNWLVWLLAVQWTLKSFLQHHSSKASILQHSAFFMVQLSHPYMTTGKTTTFARWAFVSKVTSLLFNMLSGLVTAFLPRSKWTGETSID